MKKMMVANRPDITRQPPSYPAPRAARLQQLVRGDEGFLLALGYSTQRGYGRNHPFAGEIRTSTLLPSLYANYLPDSGHIWVNHGGDWTDLVAAPVRQILLLRRDTLG